MRLISFTFLMMLFLGNNVFAQTRDTVIYRPFLEIGGGYLFNGNGTVSYEVSSLATDYDNFNHGMTGSLRFGTPVFKILDATFGLAGKYSLGTGIPFKNAIRTYYEQEYPGLSFEIKTPPVFFRTIETGPYIRRKINKWQVDFEFLFGFASMSFPELMIMGSKSNDGLLWGQEDNVNVYVLRSYFRQRVSVISPSLSVGYYFKDDRYLFVRAELMRGSGYLLYNFEENYPEIRQSRYSTLTELEYYKALNRGYSRSFLLPSLQVGTSIGIMK